MSFKASGRKTRPERVKPVSSQPAYASRPNKTSFSRRSSASSTTSTSSIASFHSARNNPYTDPVPDTRHTSSSTPSEPPQSLRFTPSQEALHISTSNTFKSQANTQFSNGDFSSAIGTYDKAIAELPSYLDYELAVLQSNIAACHIRLEEWKDAVKATEQGWQGLENIDPTEKKKSKTENGDVEKDKVGEAGVVELPDSNDDAADEEILRKLDLSDQRKADVRRIRTKLLLRRARARYMLGTATKSASSKKEDKNPFAQASQLTSSDPASTSAWTNLSSALGDYQKLSQPAYFSTLPASDQKTVRSALAVLPGLVDTAKEKEVAEMMGKLKELGNGILRPFGLSTDMFKMEKDASGGMSLKFDGGKKE